MKRNRNLVKEMPRYFVLHSRIYVISDVIHAMYEQNHKQEERAYQTGNLEYNFKVRLSAYNDDYVPKVEYKVYSDSRLAHYEDDVPALCKGEIVTRPVISRDGTKEDVPVLLYKCGDVKVDENGEAVYEHRRGDFVLDNNGNKITENDDIRNNKLILDAVYNPATEQFVYEQRSHYYDNQRGCGGVRTESSDILVANTYDEACDLLINQQEDYIKQLKKTLKEANKELKSVKEKKGNEPVAIDELVKREHWELYSFLKKQKYYVSENSAVMCVDVFDISIEHMSVVIGVEENNGSYNSSYNHSFSYNKENDTFEFFDNRRGYSWDREEKVERFLFHTELEAEQQLRVFQNARIKEENAKIEAMRISKEDTSKRITKLRREAKKNEK